MKIRHSLFAGAAIAAMSLPVLAHAGEVAGTVSDTSNTIALRSAQVRIVELDRVTATSRDGSFLFADVPAGDYTLEITYVGAETATRSISVPATGTVREDFALAGFGDDEILVVGQAANLSSALSRKKEADGISDVLTRDAIGQFPDQNVAESLRRLPGVIALFLHSTAPGETSVSRTSRAKGWSRSHSSFGMCWKYQTMSPVSASRASVELV